MTARRALETAVVLGALGAACVLQPAEHTAYEACEPGETCTLGTCQPVGFATSSASGRICTQPCASQNDCPLGPANARCVAGPSSPPQCYRACVPGTFCPAGSDCRPVRDASGATLHLCVPVTGDAARAYAPCTPAGARCADGTTCTATHAGGEAQCTTRCPSGDARACPGYVAGAAQQVVACASLGGDPSVSQCVRRCDAGADADCATVPGTRCRRVTAGAGATLAVCVP